MWSLSKKLSCPLAHNETRGKANRPTAARAAQSSSWRRSSTRIVKNSARERAMLGPRTAELSSIVAQSYLVLLCSQRAQRDGHSADGLVDFGFVEARKRQPGVGRRLAIEGKLATGIESHLGREGALRPAVHVDLARDAGPQGDPAAGNFE